mgnify:CR=1 FL=1
MIANDFTGQDKDWSRAIERDTISLLSKSQSLSGATNMESSAVSASQKVVGSKITQISQTAAFLDSVLSVNASVTLSNITVDGGPTRIGGLVVPDNPTRNYLVTFTASTMYTHLALKIGTIIPTIPMYPAGMTFFTIGSINAETVVTTRTIEVALNIPVGTNIDLVALGITYDPAYPNDVSTVLNATVSVRGIL